MNNISLIGRLGKDPEIKTVGDTVKASFSLAVDRGRKDRDGNKITDWFNVEVWGKSAEAYVKPYGAKGRIAAITGSMQNNAYEKDGQKRDFWVVNASSVAFVDKRDDQDQQPAARPAVSAPF